MFKALPVGTLLNADLSHIVGLQRSSNRPPMPLGGGAAKPTEAWVLTVAAGPSVVVYVFLRAPSDIAAPGQLFRSTREPGQQVTREELEAAALKLVADKGFEMVPLPLDTASEDEQLAWFGQLPFPAQLTSRPSIEGFVPGSFALPPLQTSHSTDFSRKSDAAQDAADAAKLGRLLALF